MPNSPSNLSRVSILVIDGVFASTAMQAMDQFQMAAQRINRHQSPEAAFRTTLVSPTGEPVSGFGEVPVAAHSALDDEAEVIVLPAFWGDFDELRQRYPQIIPWLQRRHAAGAILCGVATGVFWMAASGLMTGKEATTYWRFYQEFRQRFPQVQLNEDKHLTDADQLYCASGVTSSGDLYLYVIEQLCGLPVAQAVARDSLFEVQRSYTPGRLGFGGQKLHQDPLILQIQQWLEEHFAEKFRFEDVARLHGMSIRNFMRRFQAATGEKPLHYLQRLRIETAKTLLSSTRKSIKTISYEVGYDDASFFARLFRQHTELSPHQYRRQHLPGDSRS